MQRFGGARAFSVFTGRGARGAGLAFRRPNAPPMPKMRGTTGGSQGRAAGKGASKSVPQNDLTLRPEGDCVGALRAPRGIYADTPARRARPRSCHKRRALDARRHGNYPLLLRLHRAVFVMPFVPPRARPVPWRCRKLRAIRDRATPQQRRRGCPPCIVRNGLLTSSPAHLAAPPLPSPDPP